MANIRGDKAAEAKQARLVVTGVFKQKGENLTGYNVALKFANDLLTDKDIQAGKGQSAPMLAYNKYIDKNGKEQTSYTVPYSENQVKEMMAVGKLSGNKKVKTPEELTGAVIEGDVFPDKGYLKVNTKTLNKPAKAYNKENDTKNTAILRENAKAAREAKAAQAQADETAIEAEDTTQFEG